MRPEPASAPPPRKTRRLWGSLALVALLVLLASVALRVALELPFVRASILDWASQRIEAASGLRLVVEDFGLRVRGGRLTVAGLRLEDAQGRVFLAAPRLEADVDLSALFAGDLVLESLYLERPTLDLAALPERPEESDAEMREPFSLPLSVSHLTIEDATIEGTPLPERAAGWVQRWRAEGVGLDGSLERDRFALNLSSARVKLRGGRMDARELDAIAAAEGPFAGPWRLSRLSVRGEGLDLEVPTAEIGLGDDAPARLELRLDADFARLVPKGRVPEVLVPEVTTGRARATGELDLRRLRGRLQLPAEELPGTLLEPWLGPGTLERLGAADSTLAVSADLELAPDDSERVAGEATLVWSAGEDHAREFPLLEPEILRLEAALIDGGVDERGRLDWRTLAGRVEVRARALPAEVAAPFLGESFERFSLAGARIDLEGTVLAEADAPEQGRIALSAQLEQNGEPWLVAHANTVEPPGKDAGLAVDFEAEVLPELSGERRVRGRLYAASRAEIERAELRDVRAKVTAPELPELVKALQVRWPALLPAALVDRVGGSATLDATARGPLRSPRVAGKLSWRPGEGARVLGHFDVTFDEAPGGAAELLFENFDLAALGGPVESSGSTPESTESSTADGVGGRVSGRAAVRGELAGLVAGSRAGTLRDALAGLHGELRLEGRAITATALPSQLERVELLASGDIERLEIEQLLLEAELGSARLRGWLEPRLEPLGEAEVELELRMPELGVEDSLLELHLAESVLRVVSRRLETVAGGGELAATVPLQALADLDQLPEALRAALPRPDGPARKVELRARLPYLDVARLERWLESPIRQTSEQEGEAELPELSLEGLDLALALDPQRPADASGRLELERFEATIDDPALETSHRVRLASLLSVEIGDGLVRTGPVRLEVDAHALELDARAELERDWQPGQPLDAVVKRLHAAANGVIPAASLAPLLAGGRAQGTLDVRAQVAGALDDLSGEIAIDGRGASVFYRQPYATQLADLEARIELREGRATLTAGRARLNEGPVELSGSFDPNQGVDLGTRFSSVRYRLDYGLSVDLAGELRLRWPLGESAGADRDQGRPRISGQVEVTRGLLRRDLDLEREVLAFLRGVEEEQADELAQRLDLDLRVTTAAGVRVRNNVADMRVRWSPIQVRGTLAEPILAGTVEVDPGGTLFAYGQTARVDRGEMRLPGRPGADPQFRLEVTSSFEDPTVASRGRRSLDPFETADTLAPATAEEQLLTGLAGDLGGRVAAGLSRGLGGLVTVSLRPVHLLSESDPDARLTLTRDLNPYVALGLGINLRTAERRTYLLDLREVPRVPGLLGQVFSNEEGNEGATIEHSFELGGTHPSELPRLRRLLIDAPPPVNAGRLRRAIALSPGDEVYDGVLFDVEVDAEEALRRQGFTDPEVKASSAPAQGSGRVDLRVAVEPGARAEVTFSGDLPSPAERSAIASLYRTDYYEPVSLEEMAEATAAALRGRGFLEPKVTTQVEPGGDGGEGHVRRVRVEAEGGRRVEIEELVWEGVDEETALRLDGRFAGLRSRVELAVGRPSADATVRSVLAARGFPDAQVRSRELDPRGSPLRVGVEIGKRLRIASVEVLGTGEIELSPLLEAGEPVDTDRLVAAAFDLEEALRERGYLDARATAVIDRRAGTYDADVVLEVEPGPQYRLERLELAGLGASRRALVDRLVAAEPGESLDDGDLDRARRNLWGSGLFSAVDLETVLDPSGNAVLRVGVEEAPRFDLGYGLRYESEVGLGAVADLVDRNFFGWGAQVGLRLLYRQDDERARLWFASPRLLGSRFTLEGFAEVSQEVQLDTFDGVDFETFIDSLDTSVQLSWPLTARARGRVYARYRDETFVFEDLFGPIELRLRSPILGLQFLWAPSADRFLATTHGLFASADLSGSGAALGSDFELLRFLGQVGLVREVFRLGGRPVDWAQSWRVGLAESFDQELIFRERFFAGGAFSVRGYERESLGPEEPLGALVRPAGGEALLVINQELRFPVWRDVAGVLFLDAGNVWEDTGDFGRDLAVGLGLGGRWSSPIGLLRLDVAFPLDRREQDSSMKLYIGLGHVF